MHLVINNNTGAKVGEFRRGLSGIPGTSHHFTFSSSTAILAGEIFTIEIIEEGPVPQPAPVRSFQLNTIESHLASLCGFAGRQALAAEQMAAFQGKFEASIAQELDYMQTTIRAQADTIDRLNRELLRSKNQDAGEPPS